MRFTGRPRCEYAVTDRKRAAVVRWQRRQRDSLPLLAPLIAETQPGIDAVMEERVARWSRLEQDWRDRRARQAVMVAAHLVYGAVLGALDDRWRR